ncbi:hypothetical protein [uncultured Sulfitobacter sp.]|uniref:hypothetical protein n=1 Tax=uncultured Sulfitobacter sp. TaxID=191468 RepID=UPI002606CF0D|nr:hypothetical protein [uncultured Sulfitobacter sp.]
MQHEQDLTHSLRNVLGSRRIIVLGAVCGFGRSIVRALGDAGAQVVAVDGDAEGLSQLKGAMPLTLKGAPVDGLRRIGKAWGTARLDAVLNLMPLRKPSEIDLNIALLQGIVQGFMPALAAREGQIITVVARPDQALDVAEGAMAPALVSAQDAFVHALRRDGLTLNLISVGPEAVAPARTAILGLLQGAVRPLNGAELRL